MGCCESRDFQRKKYCFIVRHGERDDYSKQTNTSKANLQQGENPDPSLTDLGHRQAVETGQFLKKYLEKIEK